MTITNPIGIYVHVPYCRVACPYCDFVKRPIDGDAPDAFTGALIREIEFFDGPSTARSIFFGGGTPSLLTEQSFTRIFDALHRRFDLGGRASSRAAAPHSETRLARTLALPHPVIARSGVCDEAISSADRSPLARSPILSPVEISIEVNPDDVTPSRARFWRELGVNRLSLGVQAFDDDVLRFLGRCHDTATARRACEIVASEFDNWGIDLIFGAKPPDRWIASVTECLSFAPPHVSTYALTYEERTPFWNQRADAVDDDTALDQYRHAMDALGAAGYAHYEVSNFAKPGFESAHNLIYWRNETYAGFGPGAVGYIGGVRMRNVPRIAAYLDRPGEKEESLRLTDRETKVETLIQHFRTRAGISRAAYRDRFGTDLDAEFGDEIQGLVARGLLADSGHVVAPTRTGYELNNEIGLALVE